MQGEADLQLRQRLESVRPNTLTAQARGGSYQQMLVTGHPQQRTD